MLLATEVDKIYTPTLIDRKEDRDNQFFLKLIEEYPDNIIHDHYASQKKELFKIENPTTRLSESALNDLYNSWKDRLDVSLEGIWVYYPWSKRLIHILSRDEFIILRTSRNQYKISTAEQSSLRSKTIGIIGLSVGSAVALTMATERICGKLKLADFDTIELSNLNRIKTGIHNIGLNKCIVTAREIAEIDPFIAIECYTEGITKENLRPFLTGGGKLDVLVDECDDIEMKIMCRVEAKLLGIPVLMETSDRGMLDVERFDLETTRPLFHGLLDGIPEDKLVNLTPADRLPLVMKIVDVMKSSTRARMSLLEIGQTITTWPQLASAVTLGGAVVTDTCRRILLGHFTNSGRFYTDLEQIVHQTGSPLSEPEKHSNDFTFDLDRALRIVNSVYKATEGYFIDHEHIARIVEAASMAPSAGNEQPWKWIFSGNALHLFRDPSRSKTFANFNNRTSDFALGAATENAVLKAVQLGFSVKLVTVPLPEAPDLMASIIFVPAGSPEALKLENPELAAYIASRSTNREKGTHTIIPAEHFDALANIFASTNGAELHFVSETDQLLQMASVVAECNLISILNNEGHEDFFEKHIHWPWRKESEEKNTGIGVDALQLSPQLLASLPMLKDKKVAHALRVMGSGKMLTRSFEESLKNTSCFAVLSLPQNMKNRLFIGGMLGQRFWLRAEQLGYAIQPLDAPQRLFCRLSDHAGLYEDEIEKIRIMKEVFRSITNLGENSEAVFLFKIAKANTPTVRTKRLPLTEILFMSNNEI